MLWTDLFLHFFVILLIHVVVVAEVHIVYHDSVFVLVVAVGIVIVGVVVVAEKVSNYFLKLKEIQKC